MKLIARAFAAVVVLCASVANADGTVEERQEAVKLYRGSSIIAASDPKSAVYVPDFTPALCEQMREARWQTEALTRTSGSATYKCQVEWRAIVSFHPVPIQTCPDKPADNQRQQACPAGTVGTWLQDQVYTLQPYPDCWVLGEWTPTAPPEGMCPPADSDGDGVPDQADECPTVYAQTPNGCPASPPAQLPAPTNVRAAGISTSAINVQWDAVTGAAAYAVRRCIGATCEPMDQPPLICTPGTERQHVSLPAALTVSYRVQASATADCSALGVPSDPRVTATTLAPLTCANRVCRLNWTHEGTAAEGFRMVYGQRPDQLTGSVQVTPGTVMTGEVRVTAAGTWYFAVIAFAAGTDSPLSNILSQSVQ